VTWNVRLRIAGLFVCVMAPLAYFGGLHPATGSIGGLVFLLTGWIVADLFWVGIGLVVASFLPKGGLLKTATVMAVYCVSALPVALIKTSPIQPGVEVRTVESGPQRLSRDEQITIVTAIQPRQFAVGRNLPREIGGDEGCGCLYFKSQPTISEFFQKRLNWARTVGVGDTAIGTDAWAVGTGTILQLIDGDDGYEVRLFRRDQQKESDRHVFRVQGLPRDLLQTYPRQELAADFRRQASLNFVFSPWPAKLASRLFSTPIERTLQTGILDQVF